MENKYTERDINLFYERFKHLPEYFEIGNVHQLVNNPNAKATHTVKFNYKHLKFIIMTSAFIMGLSILIFWLTPFKNNESNQGLKYVQEQRMAKSLIDESKNEILNTEAVVVVPEKISVATKKESIIPLTKFNDSKEIKHFYSQHSKSLVFEDTKIEDKSECNWPIDTVLDKHDLFVYLSNDELQKLGLQIDSDKMYYFNKTPDGENSLGHVQNMEINEKIYTTYDFFMPYISNSSCTSYRWGHIFYTQIDTLIPVLNKNSENSAIHWFTPHKSIFNVLPEKYQHLEKIYNSLKCLKRNFPNNQFVNYWDKKNNIVLEQINYIELSLEELKNIGFEIFEDSVSLTHPSFDLYFNYGKNEWGFGGSTINTPYPPNPLPVIITDEKGLMQSYFGFGIRTEFDRETFNILVPVKIPLNEIISGYEYFLIFWFYPTEEFITSLPEYIRYDLKSEFELIVKGTISTKSTCNYFEVCKSTLQVDNLKVYPNPANLSITIEFKSTEDMIGKISLVNISGKQIKLLVPQSTLIAGFNSYEIDLSGINPGMYLISINTNKGFKTRRLIISR